MIKRIITIILAIFFTQVRPVVRPSPFPIVADSGFQSASAGLRDHVVGELLHLVDLVFQRLVVRLIGVAGG